MNLLRALNAPLNRSRSPTKGSRTPGIASLTVPVSNGGCYQAEKLSAVYSESNFLTMTMMPFAPWWPRLRMSSARELVRTQRVSMYISAGRNAGTRMIATRRWICW